MFRILLKTPFGFVMELVNESCYYAQGEYELYLDRVLYGRYKENVAVVFGLEPERRYQVAILTRGDQADPIFTQDASCAEKNSLVFEIETEKIDYYIDVRDYNVMGDGITNDTSGINAAIYTAPVGAVVVIPKGNYLVNEIFLKTGVDIYLEQGCFIRQNTRRSELSILKGYQKDYHHTNAVVNATWEGNPLDTYGSLFLGRNVSNIRIYGCGGIDGNGEQGGWWHNAKQKKLAFRPKNIFLNECKNITIAGITSSNSASWNIHPFYSEQIHIYGVKLESKGDSINTDGINPESCRNVEIAGCSFAVGDDCIAIKSGKYFMSQNYYRPCTNIEIRNCYMGAGHGGVAIGSELSSGVSHVHITKCFMEGTDRGLRVKTRRGRGKSAVVSELLIENIIMKDVKHCLCVNMFYNSDPDGSSTYVSSKKPLKRDHMTPVIKSIRIRQLNAIGVRGCCFFLYGLPESKIKNVSVEDSRIEFSAQRLNEVPEFLEDFKPIQNLGIFIKNVLNFTQRNNELVGKFIVIGSKEDGVCSE